MKCARLELNIKWCGDRLAGAGGGHWLTWTGWEMVDTLLVQLLALVQIVW